MTLIFEIEEISSQELQELKEDIATLVYGYTRRNPVWQQTPERSDEPDIPPSYCQCGAEIPADNPYDGYCTDCG
jgi:hypothetical protein